MKDWFEIFKVGRHTDSSGNTREWTEDDLDAIVAKYNPSEHEAPLVIGHPKDNAPAWGWVKAIKRDGKLLLAKARDVVPEFAEMVKAGMFKKRSISLNPDLTLRHIGFLGALPPAVKGLKDISFSAGDSMTIEFEDHQFSMLARILRQLREWMIEKFDADTADRVVGNWDLEELERLCMMGGKEMAYAEDSPEKKAQLARAQKYGIGVKDGGNVTKPPKYKDLTDEEDKMEEVKKLKDELAAKDQQITDITNKLKALEQETRQKGFQLFCEDLVKEGKVTPAMKGVVLDFMEILSGAGEFEFSEGIEKKKALPVEKFKEFLKGLSKQVEFGESATKSKAGEGAGDDAAMEFADANVDPERLELHKRIKGIMKRDGISYSEAVNKAMKEV